MRTAETVLNVIRDRGERGLPLEDIYRQLYNRELYLRAYGRIYPNQGAMTKGTTAETVDGMSLAKIDRIIDALRYERFRWTPVRVFPNPRPARMSQVSQSSSGGSWESRARRDQAYFSSMDSRL